MKKETGKELHLGAPNVFRGRGYEEESAKKGREEEAKEVRGKPADDGSKNQGGGFQARVGNWMQQGGGHWSL